LSPTLQALQRTGRTTRMVQAALRFALDHSDERPPPLALILVAGRDEVTRVAGMVGDYLASIAPDRHVPYSLASVETPIERYLTLHHGRLVYARYPNAVPFVDHRVLEQIPWFAAALQEYHAYDLTPTPGPAPTFGTGRRRLVLPPA
jgi:hypothetical protein